MYEMLFKTVLAMLAKPIRKCPLLFDSPGCQKMFSRNRSANGFKSSRDVLGGRREKVFVPSLHRNRTIKSSENMALVRAKMTSRQNEP